MDNLYCTLTGRTIGMKLKILLRIIFILVLVNVKIWFGMDWVLIVAAVVIVSDLDSIADSLGDRMKKDC